jgi:hypothetical protein
VLLRRVLLVISLQYKLWSMSVKELLKEFEALRAGDQKKFLKAARAIKRTPPHIRLLARKVEWPDVEKRAMQATGGRIVPNSVLVEREESPF